MNYKYKCLTFDSLDSVVYKMLHLLIARPKEVFFFASKAVLEPFNLLTSSIELGIFQLLFGFCMTLSAKDLRQVMTDILDLGDSNHRGLSDGAHSSQYLY